MRRSRGAGASAAGHRVRTALRGLRTLFYIVDDVLNGGDKAGDGQSSCQVKHFAQSVHLIFEKCNIIKKE